jgi:hypothetical protein
MRASRQLDYDESLASPLAVQGPSVPITSLLARSVAYRDCEKCLVDPLGVSVLSLFAMVHRLHADELMRHATAVLEPEPDRQNLARMRAIVAEDGQRWLVEFIASEQRLQRTYETGIAASAGISGNASVNRLLRRQQQVLQERLAEFFAEFSRMLAPLAVDETTPSRHRKGG